MYLVVCTAVFREGVRRRRRSRDGVRCWGRERGGLVGEMNGAHAAGGGGGRRGREGEREREVGGRGETPLGE